MNSVNCGALFQGAVNFLSGKGPSSLCAQIRCASKKATGGNRNPKQSPGNFHGIRKGDGTRAYPGQVLMFKQQRLWFHPGLNVTIGRRFLNLVAIKEGTVRITCEKPDLNFKNDYVKKYYAGREGHTFFKKYFNVIPDPQHTRFKCIDQI